MRLIYDDITHTTQNSPGVDIKVQGWGETSTVENVDPTKFSFFGDYFSTICDALVDVGLERDVSIRSAPYDWRKAASKKNKLYLRVSYSCK